MKPTDHTLPLINRALPENPVLPENPIRAIAVAGAAIAALLGSLIIVHGAESAVNGLNGLDLLVLVGAGLVALPPWRAAPPDQPVAKRPVPVVFKIGAITTLVIALVWLAAGTTSILDQYGDVAGYIFGTVPGGAAAVLALFGILSCFGKRTAGSRALLIANLAVACLAILRILIAFVLTAAKPAAVPPTSLLMTTEGLVS
ncbi:MAG: hypothetical protein LBE08_03075 [Bifidobacteriaceae bacterium]|jgi:hypothetical protein|nr:hypothetical protein [Bifidobacteriaceae bacterium]